MDAMEGVESATEDASLASTRGAKRTAAQAFARGPPPPIRALAADVVNKIAAGEIIVAPWNALKELIENAVDAGATNLEILVKDGGTKLLQITDNGNGINKDDLPILCQRHTTSKIKEFADLSSIQTFGFRGEALASISHIAHLTVTTKTMESSCAWKAYYIEEKLTPNKPGQSADPKPCAGRQGTQISVEDLFYNVPTRRRAFRSPSEEYARILDVVGRYAVHCKNVAFSCKKHGESGLGLAVPSNASELDRIRLIHNSQVANELIPFEAANERWGFKSNGLISNANYHSKKTTLLLFINHRSVDSTAIKKALEHTYATFLPKGGHPFIYLSLQIDPARVDVNVHPTKREVNFLNEEEIIEVICEEVRERLGKVDTSRTFMTQSLLGPKKTTTPGLHTQSSMSIASPGSQTDTPNVPRTPKAAQKPYENNLVRTDSRARKITSMLPPAVPSPSHLGNDAHPTDLNVNVGSGDMEYEYQEKEHTIVRLTTIKDLRASVRSELHDGLANVFANHTFVGVVDSSSSRRIAAIQSGVKLYLIDYGLVSAEFFYQLGLTDFSNFGSIRFRSPLDLRELLKIAIEVEAARYDSSADMEPPDWNEVVEFTRDQLMASREMLREYFCLEINEEGELLAIPLLLKGYMPSMSKLPSFLLRLGPHVDWDNEKKCFESFLRELAAFYAPEGIPSSPKNILSSNSGGAEATENNSEETNSTQKDQHQAESLELDKKRYRLERCIENILFPAFRQRLVATKALRRGVVEVADLKGLYRVFERC
ncbi:hypothetical protein AAFC00_001886 [Neodothiora populina]|uniref:DNA mismatch repair protein S5 domain-containing protein n=1 Tax=Neodothiora populina TaxID=2781224 RepID=A0ABR3PQG5_9PEZI